MNENQPSVLKQALQRFVHGLLKFNTPQFMALFVTTAIVVSMVIVLIIDFLWDGRFSAELEFAGIVAPFLDSLLLVAIWAVMLDELRGEVARRKAAEHDLRLLNEGLEEKVQERTQQLLEAQGELVRKEKLAVLGQVADIVGHELRNPLGVMNNAVYFLKTVLSDADATTREYLGIIGDEIADADRIVSDLLDAVRTKPPHLQMVGVTELIDQTLRKCEIPASVTVRLDIPETLSHARVDPEQMQQVFRNLVTNGVEAMPDGGTLEILTAADEAAKTVAVSVRDSGIGMTPEQQVRLFQPMFTTKPRRVGLGLMVVKNLTLANGGTVVAQSEPGKGSTFTVTLPA